MESMRINVPLVNAKEVASLCEAGANELFCGIEPYGWRRRFKDLSINQRTTGANFTKLKDLERAISIAHRYKAKVQIAINAFFYLEQQYEMALRIIKDVLDAGADGIILADLALLLRLNRDLLEGKDVIISCAATIFNSAGVKLYKNLGVTRIIFPRAMTIAEIKEVIASDRSLEYEVFIIHNLCFFVDGFCAYCKESTDTVKKGGGRRRSVCVIPVAKMPVGGCRTRFWRQRISLKDNKQIGPIEQFSFWDKKHIEGCGACAIYDFKETGIAHLKVLDRNLPTEEKGKATLFIRRCLDLLRSSHIPKADYIEKCRDLFKKTFKVECNKYDCYYPSVFMETREANGKSYIHN